jgi:hypothetical protein
MDFERLMLSKPTSPGSTTYVSNLAAVKDADHDYGFAELAEILGLNYDATKQVIYAGNSSSYGFYLNINNTSLQVRMYIQDTIITAINTYVADLSLTRSNSRLIYKLGDNGVCFGFIYDTDLKINYIVTTGLNTSGEVKNCYFFTTGTSSDPYALYSETNSSTEISAIKVTDSSVPTILDKRSTSLVNLCPIFNGYEDFYSNNIYLGMAYPSNKPTTAHILNINNKEYVILSRYTNSNAPAIFETGNIITSS